MSYEELNALVAVSSPELSASVCEFLISKGIYRVRTADCMHEAIDHMLKTEISLFVIDGQLVATHEDLRNLVVGVDFARFIRMCEDPVSEAHVIFFRSSTDCLDLIEANNEIMEAQQAGVTCILPQPFCADRFETIAEPFILHPQAFVRSENYTGPSRRVTDVPVAVDRRNGKKPENPANDDNGDDNGGELSFG